MSTDNPHIECYMVTIPVSVLVDAKDVSQASNTARTELRKRFDSSRSVWPVVSKFEMGDSTVQRFELIDTWRFFGKLTSWPTIESLNKLSSFDLCKKAESLSDSELAKLRDEAMQMGITVDSYETYKGSCRDPKYNPLSDKCFVADCDNGAEYEGGDARYYCGMCEKHAAIRFHYVVELLSKVRDAKKAIPSVHMMKPHHSEGSNND